MNKTLLFFKGIGLLFIAFVIGRNEIIAQEQEDYRWKNVEIQGGGFVSGIVYSQTEQGLVYARTDVGGAYRWDQESNKWLPLTDHLGRDQENFTGVLSLATDPLDPDRVYLATGLYAQSWSGTGAILSSQDRGATWTTTELDIKLGGNEDGRSAGERLQVDPNLNSILYLGTTMNGLYKSTDFAATWTKVSSFPVVSSPVSSGGISFVLFDQNTSTEGNPTQTIYVGVLKSGTNLYRSTDGGVSWESVPGQPEGDFMPHQAALASDGTLYVAFSDGPGPNGIEEGIVRKMNTATDTWTNIDPPSGQGGYAGLSVDPNEPETVLVSTIDRWAGGDQVFRSTDGGASWESLFDNATWDVSDAPYAAASTPHWTGDVDLDPFNPDNAWFITGYGLWNSNNITAVDQGDAVNWFFENEGLEETVPLELISPPAGAPLISALGDIDGFKHDELNTSPAEGRLSPQYGTNQSIDYAEKNPSMMVRTHYNAAGNFGAYSTDGGDSWSSFGESPAGTTAGNQIAIAADGGSIVWAPDGASVHYSTDYGDSWIASSAIPPGLKPVADRVNADRFYAYDAASGEIWTSTDGGASFAVGATGLPTFFDWELWRASIQSVYGHEGHIWLCAKDGLYRSTDAGQEFTKVRGDIIQEALKVGFGKAKGKNSYPAIYLAGTIDGTMGFFRSDDEGATWIRINDDQHQFGGINDISGDPRTYGRIYIATGGRGVLYGEPVYDCYGDMDGSAYYDDCGECVGGNTGDEACMDIPTGMHEKEQMDVNFYPNPIVSHLVLEVKSSTKYKIASMVGKLVEEGSCSDRCTIGADLSKGMYLLIIENKKGKKSFKIIKR